MRTWNDYLQRIKYFMKWIYNEKQGSDKNQDKIEPSDWITPAIVRIKEKRSKRISPYLETEIWDKDELQTIIKYEPYKRNKVALSMLWDFNARPHEIASLKIIAISPNVTDPSTILMTWSIDPTLIYPLNESRGSKSYSFR